MLCCAMLRLLCCAVGRPRVLDRRQQLVSRDAARAAQRDQLQLCLRRQQARREVQVRGVPGVQPVCLSSLSLIDSMMIHPTCRDGRGMGHWDTQSGRDEIPGGAGWAWGGRQVGWHGPVARCLGEEVDTPASNHDPRMQCTRCGLSWAINYGTPIKGTDWGSWAPSSFIKRSYPVRPPQQPGGSTHAAPAQEMRCGFHTYAAVYRGKEAGGPFAVVPFACCVDQTLLFPIIVAYCGLPYFDLRSSPSGRSAQAVVSSTL